MDFTNVLKDKNRISARTAAVSGFSIFGSDHTFLLNKNNEMDIVIKDGRYGIYVTNGKVNVTLPKDLDYNTLDLNTALDLISKKKPKKKFVKN